MNSAVALLSLTLFLPLWSCGEEDNKKSLSGSTVSVPEAEPKVRSATPAGLLLIPSTSLTAETVTNPAQSIHSRLFSTGPTEILALLKETDDTMKAYTQRINGQLVKCLADYGPDGETLVDKDPVEFNNVASLAADGSKTLDLNFTQYLHCVEQLNEFSWRAFGKKTETDGNTYWYIRDGSKEGGFTDPRAVKVSENTDEVELWFRVGSPTSSGSGNLSHLKRNASGVIEYTHVGKGVGYGCGLHMLTSNNLIYIKVKTDQETNGQGGVECADYSEAAGIDKEYCIDGSTATFTLKSDQSECVAANLSSDHFTIPSLDYTVATHGEAVFAFSDEVPSNVAVFTSEAPPEVDE